MVLALVIRLSFLLYFAAINYCAAQNCVVMNHVSAPSISVVNLTPGAGMAVASSGSQTVNAGNGVAVIAGTSLSGNAIGTIIQPTGGGGVNAGSAVAVH